MSTRVAVVEDDEDIAGLVRRHLERTGEYTVAAFGRGEEFLAEVRARMAVAPRLKVALVQPNLDQSLKNRRRDLVAYILGRLVPLTLEADREGADLVAWPIVRGHLQRSLEELKHRIETLPAVRSEAAAGKRRHHIGVPTKARRQ